MPGQLLSRGLPLRSYLLLVLLPLVTLPLITVGWIAKTHMTQTAISQALGEVENLLRFTQANLIAQFDTAKANLELFAGGQLLNDYMTTESEENRYGILQLPLLNLFARYAKAYPYYYEIRILMPDGEEDARFVRGNLPNKNDNESASPYFKNFLADPGTLYRALFRNADNGEWAFFVGKKIFARGVGQDPTEPKQFRGVVAITLSTQLLVDTINSTHIGTGGFLFVTNQAGEILFSPSWAHLPKQLPVSLMAEVTLPNHFDPSSGLIKTDVFDKPALLHGIPLNDSLYLMALLWEEAYVESAKPLGWIVVIVTLISILLVTLLIYVTVRRVVLDPIITLSQAAHQVGGGELEILVDLGEIGELSSLAHNFNTMVVDLREGRHNLQVSYEKIRQQNEELLELDRMKDDFLANITHEFKTPLNGILGVGNALRDEAYGPFPQACRQPLQQMLDSAQRLLRLARQILDFSVLKQGQGLVRKGSVFLLDYLEQLLERFAVEAATKAIKLHCLADKEIEIYSDINHLDNIFMNLVGNAMKFTHAGHVRLHLHLLEGLAVAIVVEDSGIGIDPMRHETIFERFQQGFASQNRAYEGAGLGLAILKHSLDALSGAIHLESKPGVGTVFTVLLPMVEALSVDALMALWRRQSICGSLLSKRVAVESPSGFLVERVMPAVSVGGLSLNATILVVDDDAINREVIRANLSRHYQVIEADSGQACLMCIQEVPVDLILLDLMMPGVSGYDVLALLQERAVELQPPPVIVLSAKDQLSAISQAFHLGAVDYVTKPFHAEELMARIRAQVTLRRHAVEIMERKLTEQILSQEKAIAEAANVAKSAFLANMSHEIRTPMNAIIGLSYLAQKHDISDQHRDYLNKIEFSAQALLGIINDILDFSKIEAGKMVMESLPFSLEAVLESVVNLLNFKVAEKGLEWLIAYPGEMPGGLIGDAMRLGQVLINLVNNAIKFTEPEGKVILSVGVEAASDNSIQMRFSVQDTGIGMSLEQSERLFKPFSQADGSITRQYGGSGLGLSISKSIVEMMGGRIWVTSEPGKGSEFCFTAQFKQENTELQSMCVPSGKLTGLRVLVVDDNETSLMILQQMLETCTARPTCVGSGSAALSAVEAACDEADPYALVLMDWQMPEMDGLESSRLLLQRSNCPKIIMMSAFGRYELIQNSRELGVDGFLVKPINPSLLCDAIMDLFGEPLLHGGGQVSHPQADALNLASLVGARLLLVEDNRLNQQVAREILVGVGIEVDVANHGIEAVEMVARSRYDIGLMDLQMPQMDGLTATRRIREQPELADLPVLAMTAQAMVGDRELCLAAGMNDHVAKPIDRHLLFSALLRWLPERVQTGQLAAVPVNKTDEVKGSCSLRSVELAGVDLVAALELLGGNETLLRSLLRDFSLDYASLPLEIASLLLDETPDGLERAKHLVHSVKGLAGNLFMHELYEIALALEQTLRVGERSRRLEALSRFESAMGRVIKAISTLPEPISPIDFVVEPKRDSFVISIEVILALEAFYSLLKKQDINVDACFDSLQCLLQGAGVDDALHRLAEQIEKYDFIQAQVIVTEVAKALQLVDWLEKNEP